MPITRFSTAIRPLYPLERLEEGAREDLSESRQADKPQQADKAKRGPRNIMEGYLKLWLRKSSRRDVAAKTHEAVNDLVLSKKRDR